MSSLYDWFREDKPKRLTDTEIAEEMSVVRQTVNYWRKNGVPPERAIEWCEITGESLEDVCPSVYPKCCASAIDSYVGRYEKSE